MITPNEKNIVFLSHSSKDKKQLVKFKTSLEEKTNGTIEFFLSSDGQSIPFGRNWVASISHSLDQAKLAFLLLTANSVNSSWVAFEAGFMHAKGIRVIPVALPGVQMAHVTPPISLLQGFNMHSHEAMNNIFEVLNQEFNHQHKPTFTEEDFRTFFGAGSELVSGFFGEYSALVGRIAFHLGLLPETSLGSMLEAELVKHRIVLSKKEHKTMDGRVNNFVGSGPGIQVTADYVGKSCVMYAHGEMLPLLLPSICSVISQACKSPYRAIVSFFNGVDACGDDVHFSSRAYGTEFKVLAEGMYSFRQIEFQRPRPSYIDLVSAQPFNPNDVRDLIIGLFASGMLELKPVMEDNSEMSDLVKSLHRMRIGL